MYVNKGLLFDSELPLEQIRQFGEIFPEGCMVNQDNLLRMIDHQMRLDLLFGRFLSPGNRKTVVIRQRALSSLEFARDQRHQNGQTAFIPMFDDRISDIRQEIIEIVMKIASI